MSVRKNKLVFDCLLKRTSTRALFVSQVLYEVFDGVPSVNIVSEDVFYLHLHVHVFSVVYASYVIVAFMTIHKVNFLHDFSKLKVTEATSPSTPGVQVAT